MHLSNIKSYQQKYTMDFNKLLGQQYIKFWKTTVLQSVSIFFKFSISCAIFTILFLMFWAVIFMFHST